MEQKNLQGITIFRFVAAFYVFIFHLNLRFPIEFPSILNKFIGNGAAGMTFFFVLSGFVMAWSSKSGIRANYFKARFLRIYPAYLLMGAISLPLILDIELYKIPPSIILFTTGMQSFIPSSFSLWNFGGSWSVSTELFFYMVFPFLYPIIKKHPVASLALSYIISSLIVPFAYIIGGDSAFPYYYVSPMHRLPEFAAGVSVGVLYSAGRLKISSGIIKISLSIVSILLLTFVSTFHNSGYMNCNFSTVLATMILILVMANTRVNNGFLTTPLIYLGKISYSFYLMQIPLLMYVEKNKNSLDMFSSSHMWIILGVINVALAALSFHLVEERFSLKKPKLDAMNNGDISTS